MKIAVEGCAHGELEKIYNTIESIQKEQNMKIDLLLCCGDFQSTRNLADLQTMAVPKKYQDMGTFYKYYNGELLAPVLTIFIGGNHEASNYLQEVPYGGWVAPNIYYLGYAGVIRVGGIRIAGISGIYKGHDFLRGRHEFSPYTESSIRSVYHVRQLDVFRLKQISGKLDIFLSHDWPRGIYNYGNKEQLLRFKPHFREEIENNQLGSRPLEDLLQTLKPSMWFAAHLHCQFVALVPHDFDDYDNDNNDDDKDKDNGVVSKDKPERHTKFLALDKCLPRRRFLQVVEIPSSSGDNDNTDENIDDKSRLEIEYDLEWLTILHQTNHLISVKNCNYYMPGPRRNNPDERFQFTPTEDELEMVRKKFNDDLRVPDNFICTVPSYDPKQDNMSAYIPQPKAQIHLNTSQFCDTLGIDDPVSLAMVISGQELSHSSTFNSSTLSFNDSYTSVSSELSLSAMRFDVSTSSEGSPGGQRRGNLSLTLPKPNAIDNDKSPSLVSHVKRKIDINPDEVQLSNSGSDTNNEVEEEEEEEENNESVNSIAADSATETEEFNLNVSVESNSSISPAKKFKRRNQNIYAEKCDVDEENA